MPRIARLAPLALVFVCAVGAAACGSAHTQSTWAAKINGDTITMAQWHDYQTVVARNGLAGTSQDTIDHLIDEHLRLQEAARRGLTCSDADTRDFISRNNALNQQIGWAGEYALLTNAYANGAAVTKDMILAAATAKAISPAAETAIVTWQASATFIGFTKDECTLGRLNYAAAGETPPSGTGIPTPPPEAVVAQTTPRPNAIGTLTAQLRVQATIEIAIPHTPPPTSTPFGR